MNGKPEAQGYSLNACYDTGYLHRVSESQTQLLINAFRVLAALPVRHCLENFKETKEFIVGKQRTFHRNNR